MRLKKQFLHLYCNSDKKGFLTRNKIEITAMAFNDFFGQRKARFHDPRMRPFGRGMFFPPARPDRRKCFRSSKKYILPLVSPAMKMRCTPCFWRLHASTALSKKIAQHRTQFHIGKRHLIRKIEPHLKFCPLYLRHAVVVFNQRIYDGIFTERNIGVTR